MDKIAKVASAAVLLAASAGANALVVFDGWQFTTSGGTTTNIGHLILGGGKATVLQEVDAGGNPFVGADFSEYGAVYSLTYTPESTPGIQDSGAQGLLAGPVQVEFVFDGLAGTVTSVDALTGAISYAFTPNVGTVTLREQVTQSILATFDVIDPSSGSFGNSIFSGGTTGTTSLTALALTGNGVFGNSAGASLDSLISTGALFALVSTNNRLDNGPFTIIGSCAVGNNCATGVVTSAGQFNIAAVPEPGILSLIALGLVGLGRVTQRKLN